MAYCDSCNNNEFIRGIHYKCLDCPLLAVPREECSQHRAPLQAGKQISFKIVTDSHVYFLDADTHDDAIAWCAAVKLKARVWITYRPLLCTLTTAPTRTCARIIGH
eukprot:TRINITY_DN2889_c0_g1_i2.p1 TRINITY_DN2889_c0_g1~~TRINITY_DN2889_c0_g1_i2.p1  ORF type:complete len:106 (-),score=12.82 TRINITY_DN2889_c0_g1_i2:344-661(-)